MSTELRAPYPAIEVISVLPNPSLGDSENLASSVNVRRSMDGTKRTYVKRSNRRALSLDYTLTRSKALEVIAFIRQYHSTRIGYKDHLGREWQGYILPNPVELETAGRDRVTVRLEFEGELV